MVKDSYLVMIMHGSGQIVNVSSAGGRFGVPLQAPYCAAKFAFLGYTESLQLDVSGHYGCLLN
jgi:short-subunit dehydrogenase